MDPVVPPVDDVAHTERVMVFVSSVTAPYSRAGARPRSPLSPTVMLVAARMVPTNVALVPRVAELPTCQKTLHA